MYMYLTLLISLISSIFFMENWLYGKYPKLIQLVAPFVSSTAIYFILLSFWKDGAFFSALISGQIVCFIYKFYSQKSKRLIS